MKLWTILLAEVVACVVCTAHSLPAAEPVSNDPQPKVNIVGKLVLPKDSMQGELRAAKIRKLTGTLRRQSKTQMPLPYPEGYENFTKEEQQAWVKEFFKSSEYTKHLPAMLSYAMAERLIQPIPIVFKGDGSFSVEGLDPGTYLIEACIPHDKVDGLSHATCKHLVEIAGERKVADLGEMTLTLHTVIAPGDTAPDFTAQTYDGKTFKLSDHRGKFVLLDFWATWCVPCVAELPNLNAVYRDYRGDHFEMVGLSLDESIDAPKAFEKERPSAYVHCYAGERTESPAYKLYGVKTIPSIWLIGPDGKVVARDLRGHSVREAVSKAMAETNSRK